MPFMMKILSGSHIGSELLLEDGTYILGRDDSCDIILSDADIAPSHCRLEIKEDVLLMTALEGNVRNGTQQFTKGETVSVSPRTIVRFGMTVAYFFREWDSIEDIALPALWSDEKPSSEASENTSASPGEDEEKREEKTKVELPKNKGRMSLVGRWTLVVGTLGLIMALIFSSILFMSYKSRKEKERNLPPVVSPTAEEIQAFLSSQGYPFIHVTSKSAGLFKLEGLVSSDEKKLQLRQILTQKPYPFQFQVMTLKEVEDIIKSVLTYRTIGESSIEAKEDGTVHIGCILSSSKDVDKVRQRVQSEISFMNFLSIQWDIHTIDEMEQYLAQILRNKLFEGLEITREKDQILVSGSFPKKMENEYRNLIKDFVNRYGAGFLKDKAHVEIPITPAPPALSIETVAIGSSNFIVTSSGRRIVEGEEVDNGYTVEEIKEDKVILRYSDGSNKVIPVQPNIVVKYSW
jgi:type III secretion system YscD/HrpQ family protein